MADQKSGPLLASVLTIISIVIHTCGFVRIELEFNKQKNKINELDSVVESMKASNDNDIAKGKLFGKTKQIISNIIFSEWNLT